MCFLIIKRESIRQTRRTSSYLDLISLPSRGSCRIFQFSPARCMTLPSPSCLKSAKFTISSGRESKGGKKSSPKAATTLNRDPKPMRKALSIPAWGTSATEGKNRGSHRAGLGPAQVPGGCAWLGGAGTHRPVLAPAGTQGWVRATLASHLPPLAACIASELLQ